MKSPDEKIVMISASGFDCEMKIAETVMDVVASSSDLKLKYS